MLRIQLFFRSVPCSALLHVFVVSAWWEHRRVVSSGFYSPTTLLLGVCCRVNLCFCRDYIHDIENHNAKLCARNQ